MANSKGSFRRGEDADTAYCNGSNGFIFTNGCQQENGTINFDTSEQSVASIEKYSQKQLIVNGGHSNSTSIAHNNAQNGTVSNGKQARNGLFTDEKHISNGSNGEQIYVNGECDGNNSSKVFMEKNDQVHTDQTYVGKYDKCPEINGNSRIDGIPLDSSNIKIPRNPVVVTDKLTAEDLQDLFEDKICVLHIRNYVSQVVCDRLDAFLREQGSDQYTHEVRKDGRADLLYFGVNRYGFPLNSTYNDASGESLKRYFAEALPTIRSIRRVTEPDMSPIDKLRLELDETWHKNVNIATLNGQKTFCGIGRIMPSSLSELSADQPHFDAVPTSYFPQIFKQFAANIYLNVPEKGGELEIWNVTPVDVENVEKFTIPEDWRSKLPDSIKVKPGPGDLLLLNTRRPHAITKFDGDRPRTSVQTFIGLTKTSEVFLWV